MLRIQILLLYFERPNLVKNALTSIYELDYDNWELDFFDDGSSRLGEPIVRDILKEKIDQVRFFNSRDTLQDKINRGDGHIGLYMNYAVVTSDADIALVLCDDDAITPDYFRRINDYFTANPDKQWGYCHIIAFDPTTQDYHTVRHTPENWYNRHTGPISPACALDSSQIAYRTVCTKKDGIYWPFPQTGCLDANLFEKMFNRYGNCDFMGCTGQYKAIFPDQMGTRHTTMPNIF